MGFERLVREEDLNKMSSAEIEEYISTHQGILETSTEYQRKVKRIRRAIKNREYAQSSRNRKKESFGELEREVKAMHEQITVLSARNVELERENAALKDLLEKYKSSLQAAQQASGAFIQSVGGTSPAASSPSVGSNNRHSDDATGQDSGTNVPSAEHRTGLQPSTAEILHSQSQTINTSAFPISSCLL